MKILVCYQDNVNKAFHKTIRITIPKTWNQCLVTNLTKQYVEAYNRVFTNKLEVDDIHFAIYLVDNVAYIPIPSDGIISNYIYDRMKVYVRHNTHLGTSKDLPTAISPNKSTTADDTNQNTIPTSDVVRSMKSNNDIRVPSSLPSSPVVSFSLDTKTSTTPKKDINENKNKEDTVMIEKENRLLNNNVKQQRLPAETVVVPQEDVWEVVSDDTNEAASTEVANSDTIIVDQQQQLQQVIIENENEDIKSSGTVSTYMTAPLIDHFRNILDWLGVPSNLYETVVKDLENELLVSSADNTKAQQPDQIVTNKLGSLLEASYVNAMTHHAIDLVPPPPQTTTTSTTSSIKTSTPSSQTTSSSSSGRDAPSSPTSPIDYDSAGEEFEIVMNQSSQQNKTTKNSASQKNNPTVVVNQKKGNNRHHRHDTDERYHNEVADEIQRCVSE